jgi:polar amino acid transport system permease protein
MGTFWESVLFIWSRIPEDSALLSVITVHELLGNARDVAQMEFRFIEPLTMAAAFYLVVSYLSFQGIRKLEARR